jgi:molecular chaperone DnaK (HSP70)
MGKSVGIDLGTTRTVVAILDGPQPRVLESRDGRTEIASMVSIKRKGRRGAGAEAELLVGDAAFDNWEFEPENTIVSSKILIGRAVTDPEVQKARSAVAYQIVEPTQGTKDSVRVVLDGRERSPVDIAALILKKAKADAEHRLGAEVTHAVVTVPAYFSQVQKAATQRAVWDAGLTLIKLLEEPTAAAIAFGMDASPTSGPQTVVVYDLGGGTFDVSVLMIAGSTFAPLKLAGDMWLGGVNFDQVIVERMLQYVEAEYGVSEAAVRANKRAFVRFQKAAQRAKERLSSSASADVILASALTGPDGSLIDVEFEMTQAEFEKAIEPLVSRAAHLTREAVERAHLKIDEIDYVIMAGNSSRIPAVQRSMEAVFGKNKVLNTIPPKLSVAMGAAIVATRIGQRVVCQAPHSNDRTKACGHVNPDGAKNCAECGAPLSFGEASSEPASAGEDGPMSSGIQIGAIAPFNYGTQSARDHFNLYIKEGDPYPTEDPRTQIFYTRLPNQRMLSIPVYGGIDLTRATANAKQGEAVAFLPAGLKKDTPVRITLALDGNGVFEVAAQLENGKPLDLWVVRGDEDAKAIETLADVELLLAAHQGALPPSEKQALDASYDDALTLVRRKDFSNIPAAVEKIEKRIQDFQKPKVDPTAARNAIEFWNAIRQRYAWALTPESHVRIAQTLDRLTAAVTSGSASNVEEAFAFGDDTLRQLQPPLVLQLMEWRQAIHGTIGGRDPVQGAELGRRFDELERALASGDPGALDKMNALLEEASRALGQLGGQLVCGNGHEIPPGRYKCHCGDSMLLPKSGPGGSAEFSRL